MRKGSITILVACAGACGVVALKPGRPIDRPPPDPTSEGVSATTSENLAITTERAAEKERLIARLIAGDLRLADAAEAVIALNRDWPPHQPYLYELYPGRTLAERVAHMLVGAVELRLAADDPRRDEVLRRLTGELGDIAAARAEPAPGGAD